MEGNRILNNKVNNYIEEIRGSLDMDFENMSSETAMAIESIMPTIDKMQVIAEAYCRITGKKIV